MSPPDHRLPSLLEPARAALRAGHAVAQEQALALLAAQSHGAPKASDREAARGAHQALDGARGAMNARFHALLQGAASDRGPASTRGAALDWEALTLVDEAQVESDLARSRLAQQVGHVAEWEFRDLGGLVQALYGAQRLEADRLPLRPAALADALHGAVHDTVPDAQAREALLQALAPPFLQQLPGVLRTIVADLKARGVRPLTLTVGGDAGPSTRGGGPSTQRDGLRSTLGGFDARRSGQAPLGGEPSVPGPHARSGLAPFDRAGGATGRGSRPGGFDGGSDARPASRAVGRSAASDDTLRALLRRLSTLSEVAPPASAGAVTGAGDSRWTTRPVPEPAATSHGDFPASASDRLATGTPSEPGDRFALPPLHAPNLIRLHQAELERAATGALDHLVIEVVGALFDQILSDSRVPPQMARQIARLQLPVLRVTLVDPNFFASRRHPVRQFINRVASLACAYEQFDTGPGRLLLERVTRLIQDIVDGDFEQIELYTRTLHELEQHVAEAAQEAVEEQAAAPSLLARKEHQRRTQQRYRAQLQAALEPLKLPAYLHDFLTQVWSQALLDAAQPAEDPATLARYRAVGRNLVLSIQPKGATAQRQRFLLQLPGLMRDLAEGVQRIGWPTAAHQAFLDALQPSHASALRAPPLSELDHNLLARRLDSVFGAPLPVDAPGSWVEPVATEADEADADSVPVAFSAEEARQIGFVPDQTVPLEGPLTQVGTAWRTPDPTANGTALDLDLSAPDDAADGAASSAPAPDTGPVTVPMGLAPQSPALDPVAPMAQAGGLDIDLSAVAREPVEPARGGGLADHLRIGFAYEMLLEARWQKVRLSHVSPSRSFFVFTHGHRHQQTLTMTARMVRRICEGGRMRAVESAYLIERASERAREQLAALGRKGAGTSAAAREQATPA